MIEIIICLGVLGTMGFFSATKPFAKLGIELAFGFFKAIAMMTWYIMVFTAAAVYDAVVLVSYLIILLVCAFKDKEPPELATSEKGIFYIKWKLPESLQPTH